MYVYCHINWNPELVFSTFSMPKRQKIPDQTASFFTSFLIAISILKTILMRRLGFFPSPIS